MGYATIIRRILIDDDPVLQSSTRPVTAFYSGLRELVADMFDTMYAGGGVRLAANQIGVDLRVFVYDCLDAEGDWHAGTVVNRGRTGTRQPGHPTSARPQARPDKPGTGTDPRRNCAPTYRIGREKVKPDFSSIDKEVVSVDEFVMFIEQIHALADDYTSEHDPNLLVLDFLRHEQYNNYQWTALVGDVDKGFIRHAESAGIKFARYFPDPMYGFNFKVSHFGASCTGVYKEGNPAGTGINRADVAAWGGDWITFYGDWRREHRDYPSGRAYCEKKLMSADARSSFELSDLMEDVDGYNIAMRLRVGERINDVVRAVYGEGGHTSRIEPCYRGRFRDEATARAIARNMLISQEDKLINVGRDYLVEDTAEAPALLPSMLDDEKLDDFCQGFTDVLLRRIAEEHALMR